MALWAERRSRSPSIAISEEGRLEVKKVLRTLQTARALLIEDIRPIDAHTYYNDRRKQLSGSEGRE